MWRLMGGLLSHAGGLVYHSGGVVEPVESVIRVLIANYIALGWLLDFSPIGRFTIKRRCGRLVTGEAASRPSHQPLTIISDDHGLGLVFDPREWTKHATHTAAPSARECRHDRRRRAPIV
jgi:hypothetical protein